MAHLFEAARPTSKEPLHTKFAGFLFHALWLIKGPGEGLGLWTGAEQHDKGRRENGGTDENPAACSKPTRVLGTGKATAGRVDYTGAVGLLELEAAIGG